MMYGTGVHYIAYMLCCQQAQHNGVKWICIIVLLHRGVRGVEYQDVAL